MALRSCLVFLQVGNQKNSCSRTLLKARLDEIKPRLANVEVAIEYTIHEPGGFITMMIRKCGIVIDQMNLGTIEYALSHGLEHVVVRSAMSDEYDIHFSSP